MRRRDFLVLVGWAATLAARAGTTPPSAAPAASEPSLVVRVATYNLRNYAAVDRRVDGGFRPEWPKPEAEKAALRAVIRAARADVLALQEIGDERYLTELRRDLAAEGGPEYAHCALLDGPDGDRRLAVLSRLPFAQVTPHARLAFKVGNAPAESKRGLLEVSFATAGQPWTLYVLHLKSRLTDTPGDQFSAAHREAEARAIRDFIRERPPLASPTGETGAIPAPLVAVAGDFNDTRDAPAVRRFLEVNGRPLLQIAAAADSRGESWTYRYATADRYERVDFILLSPAFAARQKAGGVVDLPAALAASDHRLVWVDLEIQPATAKPSPPGS